MTTQEQNCIAARVLRLLVIKSPSLPLIMEELREQGVNEDGREYAREVLRGFWKELHSRAAILEYEETQDFWGTLKKLLFSI